MKFSKYVFVFCLMVLTTFSMITIVGAQEVEIAYEGVTMVEGSDPDADEVMDMAADATIEEVTSLSDDFYGSIVTIEGDIADFLNAYTFVLGEDAAIDNDQVLVINNSARPYNPDVMVGGRVQVTGRVLPSMEAIDDGAPSDYETLFDNDVSEGNRYNVVEFAQHGHLNEDYDAYTIIEIVNRDNVQVVDNND